MMRIIILSISIFIAVSLNAAAQEAYDINRTASNRYFSTVIPEKANNDLKFIGYFTTQGVVSNMYAQSEFLTGQVVGRLFGANTTVTSDQYTAAYVEQRFIPFFLYTPKILNGKVMLRASFELDWTWGDSAYGTGGNTGGAFSADQVNLQTQNLEVEYVPAKGWAINLGLQRIFDTPYNPFTVDLDKLTTTGYRLSYFGTDGVGLTVRKDWDYGRIKAGYYKLYENKPQLVDDVPLWELIGEKNLNPLWRLGGSVYYMPDRSSGAGGVSILGQGLSSLLASYNGVYTFPLNNRPYESDIVWVGAFFGRNIDQWADPWTFTGFVNVNTGSIWTSDNGQWSKTADVLGVGASLRGSYRYGQTLRDAVSIDIIYASGDDNGLDDNKYSGVITGNQYGAPGAIMIGTGAYLLMPHGNVVNRFTPAILDLSNMGYGMTAATLNLSRGFIPNRLSAKIGGAFAMSNVAPEGGGSIIGAEVNANVIYTLGPFMTVELHGAYLALGDFYDSRDASHGSAVNGGIDGRPLNPWTCFVAFKWLMF